VLDESAIGLSTYQQFTYTWRDLILYNLSVGAGQDELEYVYDKKLKAVPTFGATPCLATFGMEPYAYEPILPTEQIPGVRTDGTLHMEHRLEIYGEIPIEGTLSVEKVITGVYDRGEGKGVKVTTDVNVRDQEGRLLFKNTMGALNRWYGGFGGQRPPHVEHVIPQREPDLLLEGRYALNAPLLYRLMGDTYPIHVDPEVAGQFGYERPIMHGLCGLGYACRLMVRELFPGEPERMTSIECQFRNVALPGEEFEVQVWKTAPGEAAFRLVKKSDGKAVLEFGKMTWKM